MGGRSKHETKPNDKTALHWIQLKTVTSVYIKNKESDKVNKDLSKTVLVWNQL